MDTDEEITYPLGRNRQWADEPDNPYIPKRPAVIGEVGHPSPTGNSVLRIGRMLEDGHGWEGGLAHVVLTPRERERLIADLVAHRAFAPIGSVGDERVVAVWFITEAGNTELAGKVRAGVERMCNEVGLDMDAGGRFFDLSVSVFDNGRPVWGSEFDGNENNAAGG